MSKPITSVAIMMLVEQDLLSLDDAAEEYLPEFQDMRVYVAGSLDDMVTEPVRRPITIRDLLLHDSGIAYHFTGETPVHRYYRKYGVMRDTPVARSAEDGKPARSLDDLVQRIGDAPLLQHPGLGLSYSCSTTVLGAVIERVTGQSLSDALRAMLFEPLGMQDTGFFISEAAIQEMFRAHLAIGGSGSSTTAFAYGFALGDQDTERAGRQPAGTVGWSGSGNTFFFIHPGNGLIGLFMTHELTPGAHADRSAEFRQIMTRAAAALSRGRH